MPEIGDRAPAFRLARLDGEICTPPDGGKGGAFLIVFFETDCPTCQVALPYLNRLSRALEPESDRILAISQDSRERTRGLADHLDLRFPIALDPGLEASRLYDPLAVPGFFLIGRDGLILDKEIGLDKNRLNQLAGSLLDLTGRQRVEIAARFDGIPDRKPGCGSRHREPRTEAPEDVAVTEISPSVPGSLADPASRISLEDGVDPYEYCANAFGDPLPVIPPTVERVQGMLSATAVSPREIVGLIPPNYGIATIEKIAANAVMAGCRPELMRVLLPLIRAACDERFNLHGLQATTHFAAPLIIINGPVRRELGFACGSNVFANVSRSNSTLGRAFQLILSNVGGARPGDIDMSTLGNPGKFSYCIAENEEENPWEPLHVELGFRAEQSAVTLYAAEPPHGVSEHNARAGIPIMKAISRALATVWSYRVCNGPEALVVLCPEHARTIARDNWTKEEIRRYLFDHTAIPVRLYREDPGEGTAAASAYERIELDGEECFRKFREPPAIKIVVAGGTAGKFSAVLGSWATGNRGSQMVTYEIP